MFMVFKDFESEKERKGYVKLNVLLWPSIAFLLLKDGSRGKSVDLVESLIAVGIFVFFLRVLICCIRAYQATRKSQFPK